jgi:hypothetical protein
MTSKLAVQFLLLSLCGSYALADEAQLAADKQLLLDAKQLVGEFAANLKPQLKSAMQSGGAVNAVEVCASQAPLIAERLSNESGWQLKRVSLKARNQTSAIGDSWEKQVLQDFDLRAAKGEDISKLVAVKQDANSFRFMKAQAVESLCLNCHGTEIKSEVLEVLNKHYPADMARGYRVGEVRGAFSLTKTLR